MDDTFFIYLTVCGMFAFSFAILAGVFGFTYLRLQARRRTWSELASRLGLTVEQGGWFVPPRVTGMYRRHELTLDTFTRRSGRNRTIYTRIVLFVDNRADIYLALYEEGVFSKIGKFFGGEDVQVGDEAIDRRFIIKARPEMFAARLFTSINLRAKLLEAPRLNIEVDGRGLHYEQQGVETNPDKLMFLFDLLSDLADFVERG